MRNVQAACLEQSLMIPTESLTVRMGKRASTESLSHTLVDIRQRRRTGPTLAQANLLFAMACIEREVQRKNVVQLAGALVNRGPRVHEEDPPRPRRVTYLEFSPTEEYALTWNG